MKRILFMALCLVSALAMQAQRFEPNTRWPYLYATFTPGIIYLNDNTKSEGQFNIHLWGNVLHYTGADGRIYQSEDKNVGRVEIGDDAYVFCDHKMMRILATEGTQLLVKIIRGDFDSMVAGSGAYGASLNSSATRDLSSLDLGGLDKPDLASLEKQRNEGRGIPLVENYYFILNGVQVEATKKGVEKYLGDNRADDLKKFLKENKIKWKNAESLSALLKFLAK